MPKDRQGELIYAYDPLSAWCYAYRPEILHIRSTFEDVLPIRIVCGGFITGPRERPIREDEERLELEMGEVLRRSGIGFGKAFVRNLLREGSWVRRSEPGCRAALVAQEIDRSHALDFANRLCHASFWTGLPSDHPETIAGVAKSAGYDADRFMGLWQSTEGAERTVLAFADARRRGVEAYPSLFLSLGGEWSPICRGYVRAREVIPIINAQIEKSGIGSAGVA